MKKLLLATVVALVSTTAVAQSGVVCGDHAAFLKKLDAQHKEAPAAVGLAADGRMIEVIASEDGSFSILLTTPNKMSCMVVTGEGWHFLSEEEKQKLKLLTMDGS